jgi:hypothetical protein
MKDDSNSLRDLILGVRSLAGASAPIEIFRRLLDAGRSMAPSVSVYLVRQGEISGWTSSGRNPESAEVQKNFRSPLDRGWLGRVAASEDELLERDTAEEYAPERPESVETVGGALRVADRPIAIVVFDRAPGESPWHPEGLDLLFAVARQRLELILLNRQLETAQPVLASEALKRPLSEVEVEVDGPSEIEPAEPAPDASPEFEAARRYARLVATDIRLYNEEAVVLGRRNGDLAARLDEHLDQGEKTFLQRHGDLGAVGLEILHDAYVQVLAGGDASLIPSPPTPA